MGKKLAALLMVVFVLGSFSNGYAATANTITLEQAKELVQSKNRDLQKYKLNVDKAKYNLYRTEDEREDIYDTLNNIHVRRIELSREYSSLQELLNQGDVSVLDRMNQIQAQIDSLDKQMVSQSDIINSFSDNIEDARNNYDDSVKDADNYKKQMDYIVEQLYINILNQEDNLVTLKKQYELNQYLLGLEEKKLQLGKSSQLNVSKLYADLTGQNKSIIELADDIKANKGQLNHMMGRDYYDELKLTPFHVPAVVEIPDQQQLLSSALQEYNTLSRLERDIDRSRDDLNDEDDIYQFALLKLGIMEKELQLEDEKANLAKTINNLIANVKSRQEDYQLAQINLINAQRDYEWDKKRYGLGFISRLALLESELKYLNMKDKEASGAYALYMAQRSLELAKEGILIK